MNDTYKSFGLEDQVAIVTGASQGIGRTLALALAEAGAHIALVSRTQSALDQVASEIDALGRQALVVPTDIADVSQIRSMVDKVQTHFGKIDILINNAAWTVRPMRWMSPKRNGTERWTVALNPFFFCARQLHP